MGRPLKIAKATILTMTGTSLSTGLVTVSDDLDALGIIAGMPFTPNSTIGGLTAGVTYYILKVYSIHTFSVSSTDLSSNVNSTPTPLTNSSTPTKLTVSAVDLGFSNPDGSNTATNLVSYGVVGGNTGIYGSQALAQVAIGINGTGTLSSVSTSNAWVFGTGTDLANLTTGAAMQVAVANNNGGTDYVNIGFASSTHGQIVVAVANTTSVGNVIRTTGDATTLTVNQPVTFDGDVGGLTTGTTYYVLNIANTSAFTVSLQRGGAQVGLSIDTATPNAIQDHAVLTASSPINFTDANFIYANDEAGYILRQKGKRKYLVKGATSGLVAQCLTANVANTALTPNTMNILATYDDASTKYVSSLNDYQTEVFPATVAASALVQGTSYTIYTTGTTNWTSVGAASNITGITFTATGTGSGTGTAILSNANPDVISTFNTAYAANTYAGQPNPIVTINNA